VKRRAAISHQNSLDTASAAIRASHQPFADHELNSPTHVLVNATTFMNNAR
jgi:hypothetical protein